MPNSPQAGAARPRACPLCGAPRAEQFAPFCSRGCRDRDLLAWLGEDYRMAIPPSEAAPNIADPADD